MEISGSNIKSVGSIGFLKGLTTLTVKETSITSLDVSTLVNLTELVCFYSFEITSLDFSKNVNLTKLNYSFSNKNKNLNVSKKINLTELNCGNNQLSKLDIR